jgi:hypothetical protein
LSFLVTYTKIDAHTLGLNVKKGGKITTSGRIVVSADGKSRTVTVVLTFVAWRYVLMLFSLGTTCRLESPGGGSVEPKVMPGLKRESATI